jgi:hypothetical protein
VAKVPLQNISAWSHMKTVEEASSTVSKWPEWKRKRQLFSPECNGENAADAEKCKEEPEES